MWMIEWFMTAVYAYLLFNSAYLLLFAIAGRVAKGSVYHPAGGRKRNIAIFVPCYKDDTVILGTVQSLLAQDYPSFKVFVAAEGVSDQVRSQLGKLPIELVTVDFNESSTKARALHALTQILPDSFEIVMVLDADNLMSVGCLDKLNAAFDHGWHSVQLHRTAKNVNGGVAVLDGISEEINNNIFRKGQSALGFSSCLIGSAMAIDAAIFREIFSNPAILDEKGEDRGIDRFLIQHGIITEYVDDALVFDEKVFTAENFQRQRTRWYEAQISHIGSLVSSVGKAGSKGKDFWNRIIINQMPPRLLMLSFIVFVIALDLIVLYLDVNGVVPKINRWIFLFILLCTAMLVSIPKRYFTPGMIIVAIKKFPYLILHSFRALLNMRPGRREFLHTPKT
jgi:cellulose synthase/poly-beta-1,6-N-acetylglucosamine synthase-like glycosyltransferase